MCNSEKTRGDDERVRVNESGTARDMSRLVLFTCRAWSSEDATRRDQTQKFSRFTLFQSIQILTKFIRLICKVRYVSATCLRSLRTRAFNKKKSEDFDPLTRVRELGKVVTKFISLFPKFIKVTYICSLVTQEFNEKRKFNRTTIKFLSLIYQIVMKFIFQFAVYNTYLQPVENRPTTDS